MTAATVGVVGVGLYYGFRRVQTNPDFKPKLVNPAAIEMIGVDKVLSIHTNFVPPVIGKNSEKRAGLHVTGSGRRKRIINKVVGVLNPDFAAVLQSYGVALSRL